VSTSVIVEDATVFRSGLVAFALSAVISLRSPMLGYEEGSVTVTESDAVPNADAAHPVASLGDAWTFVVTELACEFVWNER
jgi:hypothetical protein